MIRSTIIPTVPLKYCQYNKGERKLTLASEYCGMPREIYIKSHHTGATVLFTCVSEDDMLFDPDQWDGEQQIYRPTTQIPNVDRLVIYNQY